MQAFAERSFAWLWIVTKYIPNGCLTERNWNDIINNEIRQKYSELERDGLRKGDAVHGSIRAPREGDRRNQRQKFVPLQAIDSINGQSVEEALNRPQFSTINCIINNVNSL